MFPKTAKPTLLNTPLHQAGEKNRISPGTTALLLCLFTFIPGCNEGDEIAEWCGKQPDGSQVKLAHDGLSINVNAGLHVANNQKISKDIIIRNPESEPIQIVQAFPLQACCSSIKIIDKEIPPNGSGTIKIQIAAGEEASTRKLEFAVGTTSNIIPKCKITAEASFLPELDISVLKSPSSALINEPSEAVVRITRRWTDGYPNSTPPTIQDNTGSILGYEQIKNSLKEGRESGISWESNDWKIQLPGIDRIGWGYIDLIAAWPDGRSKNFTLAREVTPAIRIDPKILLYKNEEKECVLVVSSCDKHPFKVLGIEGGIIKKQSAANQQKQSHTLAIELAGPPTALKKRLTIITDHEKMREVPIPILVAGTPPGD